MPNSTPRHDGPKWLLRPSHDECVAAQEGGAAIALPSLRREGEAVRPRRLEEPALAVQLEHDDIVAFERGRATDGSLTVGGYTVFGPDGQDKESNEDFALSAIFTGPHGYEWGFAAVADGVSTRTFWGSRSSRLACFSSYRYLRGYVDGLATVREPPPAGFAGLRRGFVDTLREDLHSDKAILEASRFTPPKWGADTYARLRHRDELWYNSTLLACLMGPTWGVLFQSGDGGIRLRRRFADQHIAQSVILESTDDVAISSYVSLRFSESMVQVSRILLGRSASDHGANDQADVVLATDGVDRSWQLKGGAAASDPYRPLEDEDSGIIRGELQDRVSALIAEAPVESDNHSLAYIRWTSTPQTRVALAFAAKASAANVPTSTRGAAGRSNKAETPDLLVPSEPAVQAQDDSHETPTGSSLTGSAEPAQGHLDEPPTGAAPATPTGTERPSGPDGEQDGSFAEDTGTTVAEPAERVSVLNAESGNPQTPSGAPSAGAPPDVTRPAEESGASLKSGSEPTKARCTPAPVGGDQGRLRWVGPGVHGFLNRVSVHSEGVVPPGPSSRRLRSALEQRLLARKVIGVHEDDFLIIRDFFRLDKGEAVQRELTNADTKSPGAGAGLRRELIVLLADDSLTTRVGCDCGYRRKLALAMLIEEAKAEAGRGEAERLHPPRFFHKTEWGFSDAEWNEFRYTLRNRLSPTARQLLGVEIRRD